MTELLSQRKFADLIGRSNVWVSKLVKDGKIPTVDGKIPKEAGLAAYQASQRLGYDENRKHGEAQRSKSAKAAPEQPKEPAFSVPADDEDLPSTSNLSHDKVAQAFNRARAAEKTFQAKLRELEYKQQQGILIPIDQVKEDAAATAEELRGLLFAIPQRIAPICEDRPAREIESLLEQAINEALAALKKSRFHDRT